MKVRTKSSETNAFQITEADFDPAIDTIPHPTHVPRVSYAYHEKVAYVTHSRGYVMEGRVGDWIVLDPFGKPYICDAAIFEKRWETVDGASFGEQAEAVGLEVATPEETTADFNVPEDTPYLSAMMSFLDRGTGNVKQALCYPIVGLVLQQRMHEGNPQGAPWRDFVPSRDGQRWVEKGIEDVEPGVEALQEQVRVLRTEAAAMDLLRAAKRDVENQIKLVTEWVQREMLSGNVAKNEQAPAWSSLMAAKQRFDQAIASLIV
jgi:hypothetical protein